MSMFRVCGQCGHQFFADAEWKRICLPCWKRNKNAEGGVQRGDAALQRRVRELERECDRLEDALYEVRRISASNIDLAFCRLLLQLVHPDRHGGSQAANEATRRLLELRNKLT